MAAKDILKSIAGGTWRFFVARRNIAVRATFAVFFLTAWGILDVMLFFLTLFQLAFLFVFARHAESIKGFSHVLVAYQYRVLRYLTLNANLKPYPFSPFPDPMESAEDTDLSAPVPPTPAKEEPAPEKPSPAAEPEETEKPSEPIIMGYDDDPKK